MDASNEFKVFLSPSNVQKAASGNKTERKGVRQRLVPVINKVLAPSSFMAQRKTSVYKAVSGVSFQDIDIGGKKSKKRDKKDRTMFDRKEEVGLPPSESERSLMSGKSEKSLRSSQNSKSTIATTSKGDHRGVESPKKHRSSDKRRKPEKLHSSSFHSENSDKLRVSAKGERLRMRSASRTRSFSATENVHLSSQQSPVVDVVPDEAPVRPKRARSASRPRKSAAMPPPFFAVNQYNNKTHRGSSSERTSGQYSIKNKCGASDQEESHIRDCSEQGKQNDCEVADDDAYGRSRSRRKSGSTSKIEMEESGILSKGTPDKCKRGDDDEPEGGYFSLEKEEKLGSFGNITFVYEALPTNSCDEHFENDHSLEAIYVCQVFQKEESDVDEDHVYENYQIIRMTKDGDIISENDEKYENFQIVRRMKDEELHAMDLKETQQKYDDDPYENLEYVSSGKTVAQENTKAFFSRHRPKIGTSDSIPYIDSSEGSGDEIETRSSVAKGSSQSTEVTVITIKDNDNVEISRKHGSLHSKRQQLRLADRVRHNLIRERDDKDFFHENRKKSLGEDDGIVLDATDKSPSVTVASKRASLPLGGHFSKAEAFSPNRLCGVVTPPHSPYPSAISIMPKAPSKYEYKKMISVSNEQNIILSDDSMIAYSHFTEAGKTDRESRTQNSSKPIPHELSESFSDEDIHVNGEFESFSETDYELDNIDYDMFQPKLKDHRPKTEDLPPVVAPPRRKRSAKSREERRPSRRQSPEEQRIKDIILTDDLPSPKTFLALLENRHLNPPESDSESVLDEVEKIETLQIFEPHDLVVPGSMPQCYRVERGPEEHLFTTREELFHGEAEDALLVTWSDAESEFEFVNCSKVGPPQSGVAYKEMSSVECSHKSRAFPSKPSFPVKRSQSMKASLWRT